MFLQFLQNLRPDSQLYPDMQKADFVSVVVFGGKAEFAEKYLKKGSRIILKGKLRSGDYINKFNQRVFLTEVLADKQEFAESKKEEKPEIDESEILDNMNIFTDEDYETFKTENSVTEENLEEEI